MVGDEADTLARVRLNVGSPNSHIILHRLLYGLLANIVRATRPDALRVVSLGVQPAVHDCEGLQQQNAQLIAADEIRLGEARLANQLAHATEDLAPRHGLGGVDRLRVRLEVERVTIAEEDRLPRAGDSAHRDLGATGPNLLESNLQEARPDGKGSVLRWLEAGERAMAHHAQVEEDRSHLRQYEYQVAAAAQLAQLTPQGGHPCRLPGADAPRDGETPDARVGAARSPPAPPTEAPQGF
mmetsp:Transcript_121719/g.351420  ORF Transcript_121719/g.351420 Transcript_121719/m.351420 type:complete len:240 (+) Transcript_121719:338-1057(+)